ncbi:MAG: cytochrome b/b6 domain-containing protein [Desulfobacterales bacterium]
MARRKTHAPRPRSVFVWDLPTRLFHWALFCLVILAYVSGNLGGNGMVTHLRAGEAILALVLFRVAWGFLGSTPSRFASFVCGPRAVLRYLRSLPGRMTPMYPGHNPLGGWSVLAMLTLLFVQALTGLFANDDIFVTGPLYAWVSKAASDRLTRIHLLNRWLLAATAAVHVAAIFFYLLYKRENLILPMITGRKRWHGGPPPPLRRAPSTLAFLIALASFGAVWLLVR